ncbi:hypothetical protein GGI15_004064 [Coemansia interrupta]|uniref:Rab-GAP TBC domain-containing protein n=1 Tax=Coemansia interrupta TaxID=1126814 RepID=A0A9W8H6B9_9FUNG|nr:hypothetical protein GGI15_004064 [Coemansia interrupta]
MDGLLREWEELKRLTLMSVGRLQQLSFTHAHLPLRSVRWRMHLDVVPAEHFSQGDADCGRIWSVWIDKERTSYAALRRQFIVDGTRLSQETAAHPLTLDEDSPWVRYHADQELRTTIALDVARTFPDAPSGYFQSARVQQLLCDVLFVYAKEHAALGYRQGMHEVLAPLLLAVDTDAVDVGAGEAAGFVARMVDRRFVEHDAYALFERVMRVCAEWYQAGGAREAAVVVRSRQMMAQLALVDAELARHVAALDIEPQLFGLRWLRLLFGREVHGVGAVLRLWDALLGDGAGPLRLVDWTGVALLVANRQALVQADYAGCLGTLLHLPRLARPSADTLERTPPLPPAPAGTWTPPLHMLLAPELAPVQRLAVQAAYLRAAQTADAGRLVAEQHALWAAEGWAVVGAEDESDGGHRLPSNAQRQALRIASPSPSPHSMRRVSESMARATDRLASTPPSQPASLPRSLHMDDARLGASVAARRLHRHLVTRPADGDGYAAGESDGAASDSDTASMGGARTVAVDPLTLASGDTTYGIYRWHRQAGDETAGSPGHRRGSSLGAVSDAERVQRQMAAPGAFRRHFVQERARQQGRMANVVTANFVDFIALYGHFAGEEYPSDEDESGAEDAERAPLLQRQSSVRSLQATASDGKAFFLLLKAFVGTGVLVLPRAFSNGGLAASAVTMLAVAWYAWHCMVLLGDVYLVVGGSYSDLGHRLLGRWAGRLITVSVLLAQIGFCAAYTIFVATNARDLWNTLTHCRYDLAPAVWVALQLLAYVPLAWVRRIKHFAPFAVAANAFIMVGLAYVLAFDVGELARRGVSPDVVALNTARFPLLVGTSVFAFEGVTLVIPVVDSMANKHRFPVVLTRALGVCVVAFVAIGALSYLALGDAVDAVVLVNLPPVVPTFAVQLMYSLAIMMSVPLQLFPAVRILEAAVFPRALSGKRNAGVKWRKNVFRGLVVLLVALVAVVGADRLDNFIAIIGAFSCTPLSFIYPAALHYRISTARWTRIKDVALGLVGSVILVYVTYIGIASWGSSTPSIDKCASTNP